MLCLIEFIFQSIHLIEIFTFSIFFLICVFMYLSKNVAQQVRSINTRQDKTIQNRTEQNNK